MPDDVSMNGLEFEIVGSVDSDALKNMDELTASLTKIRNSLSKGFDTSHLQKLSQQIKSIDNVDKITDLANGLKSLGTVKIASNVSGEIKNIVQSVSSLDSDSTQKIQDFSNSVLGLRNLKDARIPSSLAKEINNISSAANSLKQESIDKLREFTSVVTNLGSVGSMSSGTANVLKKITSEAKNASKEVASVTNNLKQKTSRKTSISDLDKKSESGTIGQPTSELDAFLSKIGGKAYTEGNLFGTLGEIADAVQSKVSSALGMMASGFEYVGSAAKTALTPIAKFSMEVATLPIKPFISDMGGAISKLQQFISSLKRIALYRIVRYVLSALTSGIKEGIDNLYQYSTLMGTTFAGSMNTLATSFLYLKNSMASMAAPLINALAPALDFIIDKVVDLFNLFGQLFAKLTGATSYTQAVKQVTTYADAATDATKDATAAAEEYKNTLLGFDEINKLDSPTSSSGSGTSGSSGSSINYETMFEEVPISSWVSDLADKLKEAWAKADFTEIGTIAGTKIRDALESINWTKIKETCNKIAKSIATFLNGFLEVPGLWKTVGNTIAEGINTAYGFANTFVTNFHWDSLGIAVGDLINGAIEKLDWELIRATVKNTVSGIVTAMTNAIETTNWGGVGNTLAQAINTVIDAAYTFVTEFPWVKFGSSIAELLNNAIKTIEWSKLGKTINTAVTGILDMFIAFADNFNWDEFGLNVGIALEEIDWWGIYSKWCELMGKIIKGVFTAWVYSKVAGFVKDSGDDTGGSFISGVLDGISGAWDSIVEFFGGGLGTVKEKISGAWENVKSNTSEKWNSIKTNLGSTWENLKTNAGTKFSNIKENVGSAWNNVSSTTSSVWGSVKSSLGTTWSNISSNASSTFTGMKDTIGSIFSSIWSTIKNVVNSIIGGVEGMANGVVSGINTVIKALNKLNFTIPDWVPALGGKSFGFNIGTLSKVSIPRLATGGIVTSPTLAMMGEANKREAIVPLDQNTEWADNIAAVVTERMDNNTGVSKNEMESIVNGAASKIVSALSELAFYIGDEEMARAVLKGVNKYNRRQNNVIIGGV